MSQQGARWTATDASNSIISFNTVVDTTGKLSSGGFVNAGNYTFATDGLRTTGTVNFNGIALNAGVLTVDPQVLTLSAGSVTKVYDGTATLAGRALMPGGSLNGDLVNVTSTVGSFADKNAGHQDFTLSGLLLQGADKANYAFASSAVTGTGTITPKMLDVTGTQVADKPQDGNANAQVTMGTLTGLVGQEQLLVTATGRFQNASVGSNLPVAVSYSLQDGANGGRAGNYTVPLQWLKASILPVSNGNPVQPLIVPKSSGDAVMKVIFARGQAAVAEMEGKNENRQECSFLNPEKCACQDTPIIGVEMCVTPAAPMDRNAPELLSSAQPSWMN